MEPIVVLLAKELAAMIGRYNEVVSRLIEADRELAALKSDKYVPIAWVADLWEVDRHTA
jgi:hypothetical protein